MFIISKFDNKFNVHYKETVYEASIIDKTK